LVKLKKNERNPKMNKQKKCRGELFTESEIQYDYRLTYEEIKEMIKNPKFPRHFITQTGGWMYPKDEVEAFLKETNYFKRSK
jgi:hypothetical protein